MAPKNDGGVPMTSLQVQQASGVMAQAPGLGAKIAGALDSWFGPLNPLATVAYPSPKGRQLDFPVGYNLVNGAGRWPDVPTFEILRNLARHCEPVTICMETRKDQLDTIEWSFQTRDEDMKITPQLQAQIDELNEFFQFPDKQEHTWRAWRRKADDDLMILDSATFWAEPSRGGKKPYAIHVMDGSMFKPLIDGNGRMPRPPEPAYQQWLKNVPVADYTSAELTRNLRNPRPDKFFGYGPVEQIYITVNIAIRRQLLILAGYTEGTIPEMIVPTPEVWGLEQIAEFQVYWDALLSGSLGQQRHALFVPHGLDKAIFPRKFDDKSDYDEWLYRVSCSVFGLPPTPWVRQGTKGNVEQEAISGKEEGLGPYVAYWSETFTLLAWKHFGYFNVVCRPKTKGIVDPLKQAQADQIRTATGQLSINEVRESLGRDPIAGLGHTILTATGLVDIDGGVPSAMQAYQDKQDQAAAQAKLLAAGNNPDDDDETAGAADDEGENAGKMAKAAGKKKSKRRIVRMSPMVGAAKARQHLTEHIGKFLRKAGRKVAKELSERHGTVKKADSTDDDGVDEQVDAIEWDTLIAVVEPQLEAVAKRAALFALASLNVDEDKITDRVSTDAIDYAADRAAELVGMRYNDDDEIVPNPSARWAISDATREALRATIKDGVARGLSTDALAEAIQDSYAFSDLRAQTIARTELAMAHTQGTYDGWRRSGVVRGKVWLLGSDHPQEDECNDNAEDGEIPLEGEFSSGDDRPPAHPNCECSWYAVLKGAGE